MDIKNREGNVYKDERDLSSIQEGQLQILKFLDKLDQKQDEMNETLEMFRGKLNDMEDMLYRSNFEELNVNQDQIMKNIKKLTIELDRIGHRTGWIKEVSTNTAAHTLNTARKIHGATSVLDPIRDFKKTGYRDWSIKPIYGQGAMPPFYGMQPMAYPNQVYTNGMQYAGSIQMQANNYSLNQQYAQNGARTPAYVQMTPGNDLRTPSYLEQGYRTPVYEDQRTPTYSQADRYNVQENQSAHRSGNHRETGRNSAYNRHAHGNGNHDLNIALDTSPAYEPESPTYN